MFECVVNISEGHRQDILAAVADACGPALLDVHTDPDHHRSVLTLAGSAPEVADAASRLARAAVERIDLSVHTGVHPRLGAVDVVPFVRLGGGSPGAEPDPGATPGPTGEEEAAVLARTWAETTAKELGVPAFLYGAADPAGRTLPEVRRSAFRERQPDFGPGAPHPTAGGMAVGARPVLVAINCDLAPSGDLEADVALARAASRLVRERDGGLAGVRALGFALASRGRAQVSMNVTDLAATGVEAACEAVRRAVEDRSGRILEVELVGLLPAAELERCSPDFRAWSGLSPEQTIEARLARRTGSG